MGTGSNFQYISIQGMVEKHESQNICVSVIFSLFQKGATPTRHFLEEAKTRFGTPVKPCQMLLLHVARTEPDISGRSMTLLERFVVLMYDLTSEAQQS